MRDVVEFIRDKARRKGVAFADVRLVQEEGTSVSLQDRKADKLRQWQSLGLGIRVLVDGAWGFASVTEPEQSQASEYLDAALTMARASRTRIEEPGEVSEGTPVVDRVEAQFEKDPRSVPIERKMEILSAFEREAVNYGKEYIVNTQLHYGDWVTREIVCSTLGTLTESEYVRTMIGAGITAQDGEVRQKGFEHKARLGGFEWIERFTPDDISVKAARMAVSLLRAKRAPAGKFPVVFHPSITGLLVHEALGHNAEADHVLSGESILEGKLGTKVASECVSIIDDATVGGSWGSYRYDSEGTPGQRRTIIENGVLVGFMHSLETAAKMGVQPNGSARADGYHSRPIVRMSNTFIVPGEKSFEEILRDIDCGVFLKGGQWGYVFCERGQYTCHAGEGWMIRNGELAEHLRDVSVSGITLETLSNVKAVSRDFDMDMAGMCGKSGQGMYINAGGPYVLVKELVVGGQE